MIYRHSFYKSSNITNKNNRYRLHTYFNPYEYNLESNNKDKDNNDLACQYSKAHENRGELRK